MILNIEAMEPIYVQIAKWLEDEILSENIKADEKIYSQYQLAEMFNINPATAAKGLNILAEEDILYKKRGLGMFVTPHAKPAILKKRKDQTLKQMVLNLVTEAERLDIEEDELINMIKSVRNNERKGD
jgi:DNA-binding transcriptional regulator YhcF (GntR family)